MLDKSAAKALAPKAVKPGKVGKKPAPAKPAPPPPKPKSKLKGLS